MPAFIPQQNCYYCGAKNASRRSLRTAITSLPKVAEVASASRNCRCLSSSTTGPSCDTLSSKQASRNSLESRISSLEAAKSSSLRVLLSICSHRFDDVRKLYPWCSTLGRRTLVICSSPSFFLGASGREVVRTQRAPGVLNFIFLPDIQHLFGKARVIRAASATGSS